MPSQPSTGRRTQTGVPAVDELSQAATPTLGDYVGAVSAYILAAHNLSRGASKSAQIALSAGLARCMKTELEARLKGARVHAGELSVAGALRTARADVSEAHPLDGLRLAVEIKPVNLAVGRAIWNRFGDVRAFAVNIHLKFPFAIVVGVLAVPTWEWRKSVGGEGEVTTPSEMAETVDEDTEADDGLPDDAATGSRVSTLGLIDRLVRRLQRTRHRESEADAAHLLEAVAVVVYDPDVATLHPSIPPVGSGLRWDEVIQSIVETYELRFE